MYEDNQGGALARNFFSKSLHYSDANPNVRSEAECSNHLKKEESCNSYPPPKYRAECVRKNCSSYDSLERAVSEE